MAHCLYYQENCCNGCGERLLRRDIDTHLQVCEQRPVQCEHCTEEIIYADLTVSIVDIRILILRAVVAVIVW